MTIRFTARAVAMPQICACCAADADDVLPLPVRRGAYEIPYCAKCRRHVVMRRTLWTHAIGVAFGTAILSAIVVAFIDGHSFAVATTLAAVAGTIWAIGTIHRLLAAKRMQSAGCSSLTAVVHLARDERSILAFSIDSRSFAAHLLAANADIVSGLDEDAKQLMAWGASRVARVPRRISAA